MSVRYLLQASSFDTTCSHLLLTQKVGVVLRIYHHAITIRFPGDFLLHLVDAKLGNGPKRIVLEAFPDTLMENLVQGTNVTITKDDIIIKDHASVRFQHGRLWVMPPIEKSKQVINTLLQHIEKRMVRFHGLFTNPLGDELRQVKTKIESFLRVREKASLLALIGLGSGSTPIGDDAILGYILSERFLGHSLTHLHPLMQEHALQTTELSKEMLLDAYFGQYSETFLTWLLSIYQQNHEEQDAIIAKLGGNSGWMFLESFFQNTIRSLKEDKHEFISTYTR
jgi:hypothetical protein